MKLPDYAIWRQVVSRVGPSGMSPCGLKSMCLAQSMLLMDLWRFVIFSISFSFLFTYACGPLDAHTSFIFAVVHVIGHDLTLDFSLLRFHPDEIALLSSLSCGSRRLPFFSYVEEDARHWDRRRLCFAIEIADLLLEKEKCKTKASSNALS